MAEKRGNTAKLVYNFDTSRCLEVEKKGKWYRVTANTFRSYGGNRRILNIEDDLYTLYEGPTFYADTNILVPDEELQECVMFLDNTDYFYGRKRAHESKWNVSE